jgi:hypothetical protein
MLIQATLNDPKLTTNLLEDFGTSLRKEATFRDYLKTLASSKLFPIIRDVLSSDDYKQRIVDERYDFLRTKEVFNQCKNMAAERFGWVKKSL